MVKMVLSASQAQADSAFTKSQSDIQRYETVISSLELFVGESQLASQAYDNGKSYYQTVLIPFVKAGILLTEAIGNACKKFTEMYQVEVDSCDLDSDLLEQQINEAQASINNLERHRQLLSASTLPDLYTDFHLWLSGQLLNNATNTKQDLEQKLQKLLAFEASSPEIFTELASLKDIFNTGKAHTEGSWTGGSFTLPTNLNWTVMVSEKWRKRDEAFRAKEVAYHEAKVKELEQYTIYAMPYKHPMTGEVGVMWFIDKDGVRIFDDDLQNYVEKNSNRLEGIYEVVGWDTIYELDLAARRRGDGKNYLNANQLPEGWHDFAGWGAHLDSAMWYGEKTGLFDLARMAGLVYTDKKIKASNAKTASTVIDDLDDINRKANINPTDYSQTREYWTSSTEFDNIKVYQRNDLIDVNKVDIKGRTNIQRMEAGLAPLGADGNPINLHHTTQRNISSIAEVEQSFHQSNSKVIHINPSSVPSGIDRKAFNKWRSEYWKNRVKDFN